MPLTTHRRRHAAAGRLALASGLTGSVAGAWGIASASWTWSGLGLGLLAFGVAFAYVAGRARASHREAVRARAVVRRG